MEYPHRGPNISRITLEGAGGFIYAMTPVIILLLTAPLVLFAFLTAGACLSPLIHLALRRGRTLTSLAGGASGFVLVVALALILGRQPAFRAFAAASIAGGGMLAVVLHRRGPLGDGLSLHEHARTNTLS